MPTTAKALTPDQINTLIIIERATGSISVTATILLLVTFVYFKAFRTLSNTLIFYASFGNLFANVAALIGDSALRDLNGGLCQFQGFLLEMFMMSDPWWSCAMAVNVYLVFFRRYDAARLKKLYWIYGIICYGLPSIPAIFCLAYKTEAKGRMYGDATLWCWIDSNWAPVRIYSYYAPIWIAILITSVIYVRVGVEVFQTRSELAKAGGDFKTGNMDTAVEDHPDYPQPAPFSGTRTTEIKVTNDPWTTRFGETPRQTYDKNEKHSGSQDLYSITIVSSPAVAKQPRNTPYSLAKTPSSTQHRRLNTMDKIKWGYTRCALLFAISILITWVPASVNRVYGLMHPHNPSYVLNIGSAIVLPLQGFWNTVIYFMTSISICKSLWNGRASRRQRKQWRDDCGPSNVHLGGGREGDEVHLKKTGDDDSIMEMSTTRSERSVEGSL